MASYDSLWSQAGCWGCVAMFAFSDGDLWPWDQPLRCVVVVSLAGDAFKGSFYHLMGGRGRKIRNENLLRMAFFPPHTFFFFNSTCGWVLSFLSWRLTDKFIQFVCPGVKRPLEILHVLCKQMSKFALRITIKKLINSLALRLLVQDSIIS